MMSNTPKIKIKICAGWENSESITKRTIGQFLTPELNNLIEFVFDDSYDIIVFNNYITEQPKSGSKSCIFFHEPTWSGSHQKNFIKTQTDNYELVVFGYDKSHYNISGFDFLESHTKMFYGGRGPWTEGYDFWTMDNLLSNDFTKTKNISSLVSSLGVDGNYGPDGCLYRDRSNLIKNLIEVIDFVDFYSWSGDKPNVKDSIGQKKDGLVEYKFSLCIENSNEKNYASEKFFDCILTDTIPIYYGCSNIKNLVPEDCYILLDTITDVNYVSNTLYEINNNCDSIYKSKINQLKEFKKRYFTDFNPIIDFLKI